jgi:hypothetical protein
MVQVGMERRKVLLVTLLLGHMNQEGLLESCNRVFEGSILAELLLDKGIELRQQLNLVQLRYQLLVEEYIPAKVTKRI